MADKIVAKRRIIRRVITPIPGTNYVAVTQKVVANVLMTLSIRSMKDAKKHDMFECFLDPEIAFVFGEWLKPILKKYPNSDISTCGFDDEGNPLVKEIRLRP